MGYMDSIASSADSDSDTLVSEDEELELEGSLVLDEMLRFCSSFPASGVGRGVGRSSSSSGHGVAGVSVVGALRIELLSFK